MNKVHCIRLCTQQFVEQGNQTTSLQKKRKNCGEIFILMNSCRKRKRSKVVSVHIRYPGAN